MREVMPSLPDLERKVSCRRFYLSYPLIRGSLLDVCLSTLPDVSACHA